MKVIRWGILFLVAMMAGFVSASTKDYAGTWILNRAKSSGDIEEIADKIIVTVDAKQFKIEYIKKDGKSDLSEYNLNGKVTKSKRDEEVFIIKIQNKLKLIENSEALELTSYWEFEGKNLGAGTRVEISTPPKTFREVWKLQEEGKVLLIDTHDRKNLVYDRE